MSSEPFPFAAPTVNSVPLRRLQGARLLTRTMAILSFGLGAVAVGCGGSAQMSNSPGVPAKSPEDAQAEIDREAQRIVGALGGGPLRGKKERTAPKTDAPTATNAGPRTTSPQDPSAPLQPRPAAQLQPTVAPPPVSVQTVNPVAPMAQAAEEPSPPQDPCALSCDALTGMLRAVDRLCDLVGQSDQRCVSARDRASDAVDRVTQECPACPT